MKLWKLLYIPITQGVFSIFTYIITSGSFRGGHGIVDLIYAYSGFPAVYILGLINSLLEMIATFFLNFFGKNINISNYLHIPAVN